MCSWRTCGLMLRYREVSSWKLVWTDVEVPRGIQLETRVDWCWDIERYPAGNSCGLMLRYREVSRWKLMWTDVEVPRGIQLETRVDWCWDIERYPAGNSCGLMLRYREVSSWKLMWTDAEVPRGIQVESHVDWCWGTERYPAGNSCGLMLRYREISSWKHVDWPNVYWTVHHCNSWQMKIQLDVTCYFISLIMRSTCFGHYYISIFRSLRLCWWITTSGVLFSVRCVLEFLLRLIFGGVRFASWSTASTCKTNTIK